MSMPTTYSNAREYFTEAVNFLRKYSYVYQNANTCFIKAGILETLPDEFKYYFLNVDNDALNQFPLVHTHNIKLDSKELHEFRTTLENLTPFVDDGDQNSTTTLATIRKHLWKINPKKQHEIDKLAKLINDLCKPTDILIDFGAGLGYLTEQLQNLNDKVYILGLEADEYRVRAAQYRQQKSFGATIEKRISFKQKFIDEASSDFIVENVEKLLQQTKNQYNNINEVELALIGLHACADLTITSIKLFFDIPNARRLIIMPCCYHKLQTISTTTSTSLGIAHAFVNFPLSAQLGGIIKSDSKFSEYFNRPFLRLACQQTTSHWSCMSVEEHQQHGCEMFYRGIAELLLNDNQIVQKSKTSNGMCCDDSDEKFIWTFEKFSNYYNLKTKDSGDILEWCDEHHRKYDELMHIYGMNGIKLTEGLTCLQTAIQKLCENIVLYDRLCYMQEYARTHNLLINVRYEKLLNEKLSPRCYVLIAEKL